MYSSVLRKVKRPNIIDEEKHTFRKSWLTKEIKKHITKFPYKVESLAHYKEGFGRLRVHVNDFQHFSTKFLHRIHYILIIF